MIDIYRDISFCTLLYHNTSLILPTIIIRDLCVNIVNDLPWRSHISIIVKKKVYHTCNTIIH